ncbi:MAG: ATP-binding cassette domain-containing protein [Bacilli bacterium]|nr:ATP-binding cassette domain-containing protein [Bacilli bacterium]
MSTNEKKPPVLELNHVDIGFYYNGRFSTIVHDANFTINEGETVGLVGESGSGKTTIGRAIVRINKVHKGEIKFMGETISGKISRKIKREIPKNIQMVFQDPAASLNERANVNYIIGEGISNYPELYIPEGQEKKLTRKEKEKLKYEKVCEAIKSVGLLEEHLSRYPHEFSGGQRQRIGIARSVVMKPKLIIADEPISALDVSIRAQVLNLLKDYQKSNNISYLFIAHDLSVVRFISDKIIVISKGRIVEMCEAETLFDLPLHPYTQSLLSAIPVPDPHVEKTREHIDYIPRKYTRDNLPTFEEVWPGHFVLGDKDEIANYRKIAENHYKNKK